MKKVNGIANCTHPVPQNRFGIFAVHCQDNQPLSETFMLKVFNGPVAAVQAQLREVLLRPYQPTPSR